MKKLILTGSILIIILFAINIYLYFIMPDIIVTHWNELGEPNGMMNKFWGLFLLPIMTLGIFILFLFLPKIDPMKKNYIKFKKYYESFILIFIMFMFYIDILTIIWNSGFVFNMIYAIIPAIAFLFMYIGVILKNLKQNWFIGIRTPWTLSNEKVWNKTHKLGSKLFMLSGIITLLGIFFIKYMIWLVLAPVIISAIILVLYSYVEYRKMKR